MNSVIILLPDSLQYESSGYLFGVYKERTNTTCDTFYILGVEPYTFNRSLKNNAQIIGSFCGKVGKFCLVPRKKNWVSINSVNGECMVQEVVIGGVIQEFSLTRIIVYDKISFLQSELFLSTNYDNVTNEKDYFKKLAYLIKHLIPKNNANYTYNLFLPVINKLIFIFSFLNFYMLKYSPMLKFSSLGLHLKDSVRNILWFLVTWRKEKCISLQTGNYMTSVITDTLSGFIVLHLIMNSAQTEDIFKFISTTAEDIVRSIILLVEWLMGSPAGLKLNHPLSQIFGCFFKYNITLWWAFLGLMRPILEFSFLIFMRLGLLGLTFQIAIVSDIFTVATFHVYCIYIYAARLFEMQVSGLISLSRLFLGRNRNPEPGRVDSYPYTTEQLFVGTISFTVLLFLLPTTLVYYVVFVIMRVGVSAVIGLMSRARYLLQTLPIYSTWLWLFYPNYTTVSVKVSAVQRSDCMIFLHVKLVSGAWLVTTLECTPPVIRPSPVKWGDLLTKMIFGKLITQL